MNSKQTKTLRAIFERPLRSDIAWIEIENLMIALGVTISEGNGSRVRVKLNDHWATFHRPHPEKITDKGAVKAVREFLEKAGVKYE